MAENWEILRTLSEKNRYHLVKILLRKELCVHSLAKKLSVSDSAVSQHMKVLEQNGLVKGEKRGHYMHYKVQREKIAELAEELHTLAKTEKGECCEKEEHKEECEERHQKGECEEEHDEKGCCRKD